MPTPDLNATRLEPYTAGDAKTLPLPAGDLWVFGYGSLMWDPGFAVQRAEAARLFGYHRRLCQWSVHYRGTTRRPGLVLGLDRGGSCNGMALRVAGKHADAAADYLHKREMISNAYRPAVKKIYLRDGQCVEALTFLSKPGHPHFAGTLGVGEIVEVVRTARGARGPNCEYVLNTARRLRELSIEDAGLHALAAQLA